MTQKLPIAIINLLINLIKTDMAKIKTIHAY